LFPTSLYGKNKVFFESIIISSGVEYLIFRLPNVVGPKQNKNQLFSALVLQAINGKANIFRDAARDLIDIEDVCDILEILIKKDIRNEIIIIASGYSTPVLEIFNEILRILGKESNVTLLSGGNKQVFSTKKLNCLLSGKLRFNQDYYRHLIQKYALTIADDFNND
jgi:nucleoside-diphosphate-sugar epimerase